MLKEWLRRCGSFLSFVSDYVIIKFYFFILACGLIDVFNILVEIKRVEYIDSLVNELLLAYRLILRYLVILLSIFGLFGAHNKLSALRSVLR